MNNQDHRLRIEACCSSPCSMVCEMDTDGYRKLSVWQNFPVLNGGPYWMVHPAAVTTGFFTRECLCSTQSRGMTSMCRISGGHTPQCWMSSHTHAAASLDSVQSLPLNMDRFILSWTARWLRTLPWEQDEETSPENRTLTWEHAFYKRASFGGNSVRTRIRISKNNKVGPLEK